MFEYSYVSMQAAGRGPAEEELPGDSLVGGLSAALLCLAFLFGLRSQLHFK